ncbi:MAG TPA: zf-HC2 domain-containing protein [Alloacidobacterium sp.]|nr:zf-HC2 domain-containing protein [Alloacidobacterium sp.]
MTNHLSPIVLNALADGELSADQLAIAKEHLDGCSSCTSNALAQALLKTATAKSGQRYAVPRDFQERMKRLASQQPSQPETPALRSNRIPLPASRNAFAGWATAAIVLVLLGSWIFLEHHALRTNVASTENAALVTEVCDLHIATLAANQPPQVVSSDRHTVKPWFQGKLPFSFNLPDNLPDDTKLDGANLTYLHNRPVAQLLYSIGRHHVSVFIQERTSVSESSNLPTEHSGFQISTFSTQDLEGIAVSDVDPTRLSSLVGLIQRAQTDANS